MTSSVSRDTVLLLTHSADFYTIELVAEALSRKGARTFRLDTDRFPSTIKLSARTGNDRAVHLITDAGARVSSAEIRAVWLRKLWTPQMDGGLDKRYREMCIRESVSDIRELPFDLRFTCLTQRLVDRRKRFASKESVAR